MTLPRGSGVSLSGIPGNTLVQTRSGADMPAADLLWLLTADCTLLLRRLVLRLRRRGGKPQAHVSQLSGDNTK